MSNAKLVINFIIDNSASMKGERGTKFKNCLKEFDDKIHALSLQDRIEYSIIAFKGFYSAILKNYSEKLNIDELTFGGIPFVADAINSSMQNLFDRTSALVDAGYSIYKPWTIILLNGENFDNIEKVASTLLQNLKDGKMSYFPFALTDCEFDPSLGPIRKIKTLTVIKDSMYDGLFNWVLDFAKTRVYTPVNEPVTFNAQLFEGWTVK